MRQRNRSLSVSAMMSCELNLLFSSWLFLSLSLHFLVM